MCPNLYENISAETEQTLMHYRDLSLADNKSFSTKFLYARSGSPGKRKIYVYEDNKRAVLKRSFQIRMHTSFQAILG